MDILLQIYLNNFEIRNFQPPQYDETPEILLLTFNLNPAISSRDFFISSQGIEQSIAQAQASKIGPSWAQARAEPKSSEVAA